MDVAALSTLWQVPHRICATQDGQTKMGSKPCCATREKLDKRTPGLFKQEFNGDAIIALCPKTYICVGDAGNKLAHKGVSPKNNLCFEHYQKVLAECLQMGVCNKGIRSWKNNLMSYNQYKVGLTPVYIKRQVNNDGVSTEPLKLWFVKLYM